MTSKRNIIVVVMPLLLGVVASVGAQQRGSLVTFSRAEGGAAVQSAAQTKPVPQMVRGSATYAPLTPPAASDPGTLYVPSTYAQGANEPQEQFVERMKRVDAAAREQQAMALQRNRDLVRSLNAPQAARLPTEADRQARAEFARFAQQAQLNAKEAKSRARSGSRPPNQQAMPGAGYR